MIEEPRSNCVLKPWLAALLLSVAAAGCSSQNPTTPTPAPAGTMVPATAPSGPVVTIAGNLTATNGKQPLGGATVTIGSASGVADGSGHYSVAIPVAGTAPTVTLTISGDGLLSRRSSLDASSRTVNLDAIATSGGFDLDFYRQLVRNGHDASGILEPLRRWTRAPLIYLKTVDEAGAPIDAAQLESTSAVLEEAASQWSGGRFGLAGIERGAGTREGVSGYLTVKWINTADEICGRALVGKDGGYIELEFKQPSLCACGSLRVSPLTVRHELGHAFGFWHTDSTNDVMSGVNLGGCDRQPSPRERYHAAIAYSRPVGNVDPDSDPVGQVTLRTLSVR